MFKLSLFLSLCVAEPEPIIKLPNLNINPDTITTAGYSSGGYFANMFHIIYSSTIKASSSVGAGPYMCGSMPNEGLNSTAKELNDFSLKMAK